ncbi:ABC transporter ATP-binding protein [Sedimentibacter sp. zth1]|uniref:ABC transporter ATP-binding protein n=1 Tax=Sedimentibacter sp. zth1 TaxID=2816908 RepID=UPI001A91246C|nr:ABC transporter ATP-binding protein [Sedimentibacter sp. zth1]QSX05738.1 ABC transporter ATP-binding protein [Sedimentibacter sp. zth1]
MKEIIKTNNLTKDYGNNKGVFNVNLSVNEGEIFGFLGPNGAGKTTTIRHLMGFIKPDKGSCFINEKNCWNDSALIQDTLGYLPGEIAFMNNMSGIQMINFIAEMKNMKDMSRAKELTEIFELDAKGSLRRMSKGMKQKIGIICAFMNNPDIIILDEPTSGLDPLMQNRFIDLLLEEQKKGKTIFISSHNFEEIEKTCDRTAIIKDGKIIAIEDMATLKDKKAKSYIITFNSEDDVNKIKSKKYKISSIQNNTVTISVTGNISPLLRDISELNIKDLEIKTQTLEELFLHFYGGDK